MKHLRKISAGIDKVAIIVTLAAIIGYITVMFTQVALRNLAPKYALPWADGVCRYCFIWASFMGAALAVKRRKHIAITIVSDSLKGFAGKICHLFIAVVFLALLITTFSVGVKGVMLTSVQKSDTLPIAAAWIYAAIPVGALFSLFQLFVTTLEDFMDPGGSRSAADGSKEEGAI
ncbi:MAG: TRAP transporter small permease [Gracilibacteraceae bacterium]|nr:TRAP transporter small permease [Gracilibacteraceae bacterium]